VFAYSLRGASGARCGAAGYGEVLPVGPTTDVGPTKKPLPKQRWWDSKVTRQAGSCHRLSCNLGACLERQRRAVAGFGTKHGSDENRRLPGFKGPYPSTALDKRAGLFTCAALILSGWGEVVKGLRLELFLLLIAKCGGLCRRSQWRGVCHQATTRRRRRRNYAR
jgi:hypothetical protein